MKRNLLICLICLSSTVFPYTALALPLPSIDNDYVPISKDVMVIAHRGASAFGPENTMAAYRHAIMMKADYVEIDLQMTKDGQLIAIHDETLARTTNAKELFPNRAPWRIKDFTLEEIRRLDAGSWFNKAFPLKAKTEYIKQHVPTLEEVIELIKNTNAGLYIETKAPSVYPGMEEHVIEVLKKNNFLSYRKLFLESFSEQSLRKLKTLEPNLKLIQLYKRNMLAGKDFRLEFKRISDYASGVGPYKELVGRKLMKAAHQNYLLVHPWTVNSQNEMVSLLSLGVDGEFTNNTDQFVKLLEKPLITHGVTHGDVTDTSAILWTRTNRDASVQFEISTDRLFKTNTIGKTSHADDKHDFIVSVEFIHLKPNTKYFFRAHVGSSKVMVTGSFQTAPTENSK